jgi:hypothetical protein
MLVVKVEIWPYGQEQDAKELGRLYIANDGKALGKENQSYIAGEDREQDIILTGPNTLQIASHTRSRGFWPLVKQAVALLVRRKGL